MCFFHSNKSNNFKLFDLFFIPSITEKFFFSKLNESPALAVHFVSTELTDPLCNDRSTFWARTKNLARLGFFKSSEKKMFFLSPQLPFQKPSSSRVYCHHQQMSEHQTHTNTRTCSVFHLFRLLLFAPPHRRHRRDQSSFDLAEENSPCLLCVYSTTHIFYVCLK